MLLRYILSLLLAFQGTVQGGPATMGGPAAQVAGSGGSVPTIDHTSATNCQSFSGTTLNCAITVVNGEQLVFLGNAQAGGQSVSGSANCNGTWTLDTAVTFTFMATSKATGSGSCTVTLTATSGILNLMGVEIAGSSGIDVRNSALIDRGGIGANVSFNCPTITTVANNDLVLCLVFDNNATGSTATAGSGFSIALSSTTTNMFIESGAQVSPGSVTPAMQLSGSTNPITGAIAYKP